MIKNQCCGSGSGSGRIRSFLVTRIRENTGSGSGSFIYKKAPCYSNCLVIKLSKIQFRPNNFLIFDFKCHRMFRFGKKMPKKIFILLNIKNISKYLVGSGSGSATLRLRTCQLEVGFFRRPPLAFGDSTEVPYAW